MVVVVGELIEAETVNSNLNSDKLSKPNENKLLQNCCSSPRSQFIYTKLWLWQIWSPLKVCCPSSGKQLQASEKPIEDEEPQTFDLSWVNWILVPSVLIAFSFPKLIVPFHLPINATQVDKHHTWMNPKAENGRSCSSQIYFGPFEVHHIGHKKYRNEFNLMPFYSNGSARCKKVGRWLFDMFRMRE